VLVYNNGTVLWVPSVPLATTCSLELSNFPKDVQKCTMMFGSWVYDKTEIDLHLYREVIYGTPLDLDIPVES
jgi:hypothetical protein